MALLVAAVFLACLPGRHSMGRGGPPTLHIVEFVPPPPVLRRGEVAPSALRLRIADGGGRQVWAGYSVQSPDGRWHDRPARPMELPPTPDTVDVEMSWLVPEDAPHGFYRVVQAIWSAPPGAPQAERLASVDRRDAFRVAAIRGAGGRLDTERWERGDHRLGRGGVARANVRPADDALLLVLPAGTRAGAELRSARRVGHGRFTARLRTPYAPGSLTAFFLYADRPENNDEIDIELFNDGSRRALLTVWRAGEMVHQKEITLPFDPAEAVHEYTIDRQPGALTFQVNGAPVGRWEADLPADSMKVMLNAWWPTWLSGPEPEEDAAARIERVTW